MKKSFMSISLLVVSISMLALFLCSSFVHAGNSSLFIYNKSENTEIVYTLDETGKLLIPKLKVCESGRSTVAEYPRVSLK